MLATTWQTVVLEPTQSMAEADTIEFSVMQDLTFLLEALAATIYMAVQTLMCCWEMQETIGYSATLATTRCKVAQEMMPLSVTKATIFCAAISVTTRCWVELAMTSCSALRVRICCLAALATTYSKDKEPLTSWQVGMEMTRSLILEVETPWMSPQRITPASIPRKDC